MSGLSYTTRLIDEWLRELFDELPALLITGPRAAGKTTTAGRLIAKLSGGDVVAIEIKSSAAPKRGDASHLEWLREQLGERFLAGAVLHTGPRPFRLAERIFALRSARYGMMSPRLA